MSEQQKRQQQRAEQPGPAPAQDPLGPQDRAHFVQELQELGLLEFAEEMNFNRFTEIPGDVGLSSGWGRPGPVGYNNPPPPPTQPLEIQQCLLKNQAVDMATAHAIQVLHLAKISLHQLVTSYSHRAAGCGGTDGSSKRRKTSRGADVSGSRSGSKGLRHFSMKVCEKVEAKGRTTYNEVADELVNEMSRAEANNKNGQYDEKNIRRRVYDAINVLMAMDIIQKEKKEITWKGFPRLGNHSLEKLKAERLARIKEVEQKQLYLQDMIEQQKGLKQLLERSSSRDASPPTGAPLFLPFILVQAKPDATVEVNINQSLMDVQIDFYNSPFQVHNDSHVLKKMAEQQARQQQQQQQQAPPFPNPMAAGTRALQWPQANCASAVAASGLPGLSTAADPALAHLAAAAAQAHGNPLAFAYHPASAAAVYYHQQQQQLIQQQQQQGQQQPASQPAQGRQVQGQQQQQQRQQQNGQGQQAHGVQGEGSSQQQRQQQQQHAQQQHAQQQSSQQQQQQSQQAKQQQQQIHSHQQVKQQQLQTLQALHAIHARASLPGLALPQLGPPLLQGGPSGAGSQQPPFGGSHASAAHQQQHLTSSSQLAAQLTASLQAGSGSLHPALPFAGLGQHALAGLPSLPPHLPPTSQLLPMAHMPPALAAALAQPQAQQSAAAQPQGIPALANPSVLPAGGVGEVSMQHGMQMGQLAGPGPATALPLVA